MRGGPSHGVSSVGYQPELHAIGCCARENHGMARADALIVFAVNQQDWNSRIPDSIQRAWCEQIDAIAQPGVLYGRSDHRTPKSSSKPRLQMQRTGNPLVAHFPGG